ncbi:(-)-germacrene D synthase-like isoform X1 [Prosopis cineraria]|uniref:(-)-germacrene D synthase-like isoform X1 n=1 Tax=Prosopis cineraria TaxID=364024 RepID=UPI00240F872A|nr:(-)-germacrene D synthase-like isoform X1 [Prosopis cineraria]
MASVAASTLVIAVPSLKRHANESHIERHCADFHPSIWTDHFLQFASHSSEDDGETVQHIEALKEEVRKMLVPTNEKPSISKVELIDSIQRLGLGHHFESEIEQVLQQTHQHYVQNGQLTLDADLRLLALLFRLLRQDGYLISPDAFNKFKDEQGNFSERIRNDVEGMLNLYEAAHLSIHGEDTLDEAITFTSTQLQAISNTVEPNTFVGEQVHNSLRQSLHRGLPRLEARKYISIYHLYPSYNEVLLTLAKLDFNTLQKSHQKEVADICKWWNSLDVPRSLSYARDRIVESCFWILGVYYEPQYSLGRFILTKVMAVLSLIDDTYDAYGTIDELTIFTDALERLDICCLHDLPEYMKLIYKALLNVYDEMDQNVRKEGREYSLNYAKSELKKVVRAFMREAEWFNGNYVPTTQEYLDTATRSCSFQMLSTISFFGLGHIATEDIFKWVTSGPKLVKACSIICRAMDDIVSSEFEQKRGHVASALDCYMKEHGVSREEAIDEFRKVTNNAWKDMNEEFLRPLEVARPCMMPVLNLARVMDVLYKEEDNYTHAQGIMKDFITALLVDPVPT